MELYGIKKQPNDKRSNELLMREVYLDFYSKSLQPDNKNGVAYSKRLQIEQKQHNAELEKMLKMNQKVPELEKNPLDNKENDISNEQKALLGYKMTDDTFIESEKKDESVPGIANSLLQKMKQNTEEGQKTEEKPQDKKDEKKSEVETKDESKDQKVLGSLEKVQEELKLDEPVDNKEEQAKKDEPVKKEEPAKTEEPAKKEEEKGASKEEPKTETKK